MTKDAQIERLSQETVCLKENIATHEETIKEKSSIICSVKEKLREASSTLEKNCETI